MAPISHRSLAGGRSSSPGLSEGCWCAREAFYHETRVSWHILAQVVTVPSWRIKTFQDHGEPGAAINTTYGAARVGVLEDSPLERSSNNHEALLGAYEAPVDYCGIFPLETP